MRPPPVPPPRKGASPLNESILACYEGLPQWDRLLSHAQQSDGLAVTGLAEGERAFLAAALARRTGRRVVLLSPTEHAAQKQAQDLTRLFGEGYVMIPSRELLFSRAAASQESTWRRLSALSAMLAGEVRVLCLPVDALMDRCLPPQAFASATFPIAPCQALAPQALLDRLLLAGYERVAMVEGRGQCAMRGSILDVFPPRQTQALRIEFFGDQVDSLRSFDCISQRSTGRVEAAVIGPASEALINDPPGAAARFEKALADAGRDAGAYGHQPTRGIPAPATAGGARGATAAALHATSPSLALSSDAQLSSLDDFLFSLDALETASGEGPSTSSPPPIAPSSPQPFHHLYHLSTAIQAGHPLRNGGMWLPVLNLETTSLLAYLTFASGQVPLVLAQQPEAYPARVQARQEAFAQEFAEALRRGDAVPAQAGLLQSYEELLPHLTACPVYVLSDVRQGLGRLNVTDALAWASSPVMPYQSRLEPLARDVRAWQREGCAVVLLTGGENRGKRLQKALMDQGLPCLYGENLEALPPLAFPSLTAAAPSPQPQAETTPAGPSASLSAAPLLPPLLLPFSYSKGFLHPSARLCLIADSDLYGTAYQKARKHSTAGERIASFTDLAPGDYVVHDFHGVGLYQGIVQVPGDEVKRDYLLIHFAGNDKLYVPTDQFDRVQKFIGAEHAAPKLNRLGGGEWQRQKGRVKEGLKTLAFDLAALYQQRRQQPGYAFSSETPWQREFEDVFPYELTADQQQSVGEIHRDMESPRNMDRLLCGDVGYGKTEVALRAAFKAVLDGKQVALLAPTTILAQQHFHTIQGRFAGFPVTVEMLSRFRSRGEQKDILQRLAAGKIDLIVGTHRLLGKDVIFKDLGLLIVDEEHRFGVSHKESVQRLKTRMDVLTLSATPIPRTLHMSMAGIRDMSLLETPPEERLPVKTYVLAYDDQILQEAIRRELGRGGQVYFLYNRVRSIEQMHARLQALVPEARIGIAHGQMRETALEDVMLDFYAGAFDVLLCTTIIESGLDVPEANTLIVFDADRFGLSQLYQIRGRVGRSNRQAYAYFTVRADKLLSETADKRLSAIREFTEFGAGYRIAMRDLEIRGAGDVLGPQQHGHLSTVGYDMYLKLLEQAVGEAQGVAEAPELDTRIELGVDAYLPQTYITQELLRLEAYKRIAMIADPASRSDVLDELVDRFGDVPPPALTLADIALLRSITRRLGGSHLFLRPDGLHLRLDERFMPDAMALYAALAATDSRLAFGGKKLAELVLRQPGLDPAVALPLAIDVFGRLAAAL